VTSKPGFQCNSGMSLAGARLLASRCPACRRRESGSWLLCRTQEGAGRYCARLPGVGLGARGSASSSRNREASSTDSWRAGGPARSSGEALVMRVERRGWLIRVLITRATRVAWEETSEQVKSDSQVVSDTEAVSVGGVSARQGEQRCCRGGWAVHRVVRGRSEKQSLPDLESNVVGDVLPASGAGGGDTEAARWGGPECWVSPPWPTESLRRRLPWRWNPGRRPFSARPTHLRLLVWPTRSASSAVDQESCHSLK
jgi:hypothetical protein